MRKKIILGVLCFVLVILGVGLFSTKSDKISKNVYVKNINIGKLTKEVNIKWSLLTSNIKMMSGKYHRKQ